MRLATMLRTFLTAWTLLYAVVAEEDTSMMEPQLVASTTTKSSPSSSQRQESATTTATKVTATTLSTTSTTSPLVNVSVPSSSAPFTEESIGQWLENLNNYDDNDDLFSNDEYGSDLVTGNGTTTTGATTTDATVANSALESKTTTTTTTTATTTANETTTDESLEQWLKNFDDYMEDYYDEYYSDLVTDGTITTTPATTTRAANSALESNATTTSENEEASHVTVYNAVAGDVTETEDDRMTSTFNVTLPAATTPVGLHDNVTSLLTSNFTTESGINSTSVRADDGGTTDAADWVSPSNQTADKSSNDAGENRVTLPENLPAQEETTAAMLDDDVSGSRDGDSAKAAFGGGNGVADVTAAMLVGVAMIGLIGIAVVGGVYCVRALCSVRCMRRHRHAHLPTTDIEPLLGDDF